jgi:ElaB/YqjD/DUF883 family membrane-anchored ribosome-binding protein
MDTNASTTPGTGADRLVSDLQAVVRDAENLLKATAGDASERATKARAHVEESLNRARARIKETEQHLAAQAREAAQKTNEYVHENPWPSMGIAAGVGFVIGLLIGRR